MLFGGVAGVVMHPAPPVCAGLNFRSVSVTSSAALTETDGNAILQVINQNIGEIGCDDDGNYLLKQSLYISGGGGDLHNQSVWKKYNSRAICLAVTVFSQNHKCYTNGGAK